jgi:hypothetical protein
MAKTGPKPSVKVGDKFTTNSGWSGEVVEYFNAHKVRVLWQDGSYSFEIAHYIRNGNIKPLFQPSVSGIGFFGYGKYVPLSYKNKESWQEFVNPKIYRHWVKLLDRLTDTGRPANARYRDCTVTALWHNFQNFAAWAARQPYFEYKDACLDKDLVVKGNRHYSPDTCCFLPNIVNVFISSHYEKESGLPEGVNIIHPKTQNSKVGYVARCHFLGKREYLGYYDCPDVAGRVYKERKLAAAFALAEKYKDVIRPELYQKIIDHYK